MKTILAICSTFLMSQSSDVCPSNIDNLVAHAKSHASEHVVDLTIKNSTEGTLNAYWIDYDG